MFEEAVEQLYLARAISAQVRTRTVKYEVLEHVILDQIRTGVLGKTIDKHVDKCFQVIKSAEALGKGLLHDDKYLTQIASFFQTRNMNAIADQRRVDVFRSSSMAIGAKKEGFIDK